MFGPRYLCRFLFADGEGVIAAGVTARDARHARSRFLAIHERDLANTGRVEILSERGELLLGSEWPPH